MESKEKMKTKLVKMRIKKAQEEIVGFVLIIVLIAVIALVFLGFQLRQKPVASESKQVGNLLDSMLKYTTECAVSPPQYDTLRDLIKSCYEQDRCSNGMSACQYLQDTTDKMLASALPDIEAERPIKAYQLNASYSTTQFVFGEKSRADVLVVSKGKCTGSSMAYKEFLPLESGDIEVMLRICY